MRKFNCYLIVGFAICVSFVGCGGQPPNKVLTPVPMTQEELDTETNTAPASSDY